LDDILNTTIDTFQVPLSDPVYDGLDVYLEGELRDFGTSGRNLVMRFQDGPSHLTTVIVPWDKFTNEIDAIRARIMMENWDDALAQLAAANTEDK